MEVKCPRCGTPAIAENINMSQMAALCVKCVSLFPLELAASKRKPRKFKRPAGLRVEHGDELRLAFRTNFRLDKNEAFISSAVMSGIFSLVTLLMATLYLEGEMPLMLPLMFMIMSLAGYYALATIAWNSTRIVYDGGRLRVSRGPLPSLTREREVGLAAAESVSAEETSASRTNEYDTARFHVWANMRDGSRRLVVADLTEDYAGYIAGQLEARLREAYEADAARLAVPESASDTRLDNEADDWNASQAKPLEITAKAGKDAP